MCSCAFNVMSCRPAVDVKTQQSVSADVKFSVLTGCHRLTHVVIDVGTASHPRHSDKHDGLYAFRASGCRLQECTVKRLRMDGMQMNAMLIDDRHAWHAGIQGG